MRGTSVARNANRIRVNIHAHNAALCPDELAEQQANVTSTTTNVEYAHSSGHA